MIEVGILADSVNEKNQRITSFLLKYPRMIHSEMMTHRAFSRNAASSRAIPVNKVIQNVLDNTAMPLYWGKTQKGMQAKEEVSKESIEKGKNLWLQARDQAVDIAKKMNELSLHKQIVNRILEPFSHITVICTGTDFENFFALRSHSDAQPEFQMLADEMLKAYYFSLPKFLEPGEWHLPFGDEYIPSHFSLEQKIVVCTARAARTSYVNFDGSFSYEKDLSLHDDLKNSGHWSPFEHCAQNMNDENRYGNFLGYKQYRKFFSNENRKVNIKELYNERRNVFQMGKVD